MEPECFQFRSDSYDTPEDNRPSLGYRLFFGSSLYFVLGNMWIFMKTGSLARKGKLDQIAQIIYSGKNLKLVEKCGGRVHLRGLDNLRALNGAPAVLIGNHMSLLETAILHAVIRGIVDFTWVIKQQLLKIPFFRDIMTSSGAIPVGRDNPRDDLRAVLGEGKNRLNEGKCVIIFPQSTRSRTFNPHKFNTIGVKLARAAGVQVVPFALKTDFLEGGKVLKEIGSIHPERDVWIEFAPPMTITGNGQEEQQKIIEFIISRMNAWGVPVIGAPEEARNQQE